MWAVRGGGEGGGWKREEEQRVWGGGCCGGTHVILSELQVESGRPRGGWDEADAPEEVRRHVDGFRIDTKEVWEVCECIQVV